MSHVIRPATEHDVPMLAEVTLLASRSHLEVGVFDLAIATTERDCLTAIAAILTTEQRSWCHYENLLVIAVDAQPAAALSGYAAHDETLLPIEQTFEAAAGCPGLARLVRRDESPT